MKAALLDENGVFLRIDDVAVLTARHLPQIKVCDLPSGQYRWIADSANPMGGAFWPVKWLERKAQDVRDVQAARDAKHRLSLRRAKRKQDRGE